MVDAILSGRSGLALKWTMKKRLVEKVQRKMLPDPRLEAEERGCPL